MYFFDTYGLYQIAKGVESYSIFKKHAAISTTLMNLYELHYVICKEGDESLAELFFDRLLPFCLEIKAEDIKEASKFRLKHAKKRFSYIDALGYVIAIRQGLFFVTGDDAFESFEQVKFLK